MNIEEIKDRKREVENKILQTLVNFEKETSLVIDDINFQRENYFGGKPQLHTVKIDVKLDL